MGDHLVDDLAKALTDGTGSRKQILKVVGAVIVAAVVPSLDPPLAAAGTRAQKRCRRKRGLYLSKGTCHCAPKCVGNNPDKFHCRSDACYCYETVDPPPDKVGFCASIAGNYSEPGCQTSAECEDQTRRCVMTGFPTPSICTACPCGTGQACIDGVCRHTHCVPPCPEGG
jgi:hypothetical protein